MKTNKAIKRLAKIEALMLDVTKRYSASASHIREVLQDAQAAIARAKEAVSLQASSGTATSPPVKHSELPSKATPEPPKPRRRISEEGMQRIIAATKRRWALKRAETAKAQGAAKKAAASKSAPKKAALKAPVKTANKTAAKKQQKKKATKAPAAVAPATAQ